MPGLIRSQDFDTIFMGTSAGDPFPPEATIDRAPRRDVSLKLTMQGSQFRMKQVFVLERGPEAAPFPGGSSGRWDDWDLLSIAPEIESDRLSVDPGLYRRDAKGVPPGYLFTAARWARGKYPR